VASAEKVLCTHGRVNVTRQSVPTSKGQDRRGKPQGSTDYRLAITMEKRVKVQHSHRTRAVSASTTTKIERMVWPRRKGELPDMAVVAGGKA
jgi:hypothetical protein